MIKREKDFINSVDLEQYNVIKLVTLCNMFNVRATHYNALKLANELGAVFTGSSLAYFKKPTILKRSV